MSEEPRLADDIDPNKLLIEIVQGLLMAHGRLDHMEQALCKAVESASWKHLCSFDERLSTVDLRFKRTTADADSAVASLREVGDSLVQAVESASLDHLRAFEKNLNTVDLRFKQTTADADKAVASLKKVKDDLVSSVQATSIKHYDVFKGEVASIQANIDHLRTEGVLSLAADIKDNRLVERQRFDEMVSSLKHLSSNDAAQKSSGLAESTKQNENWKNLYKFLQGFQTASATSAADLKRQINDKTKFLSHENEALSEHLTSVVKLVNMSEVKRSAEMRQVRILLYWLIFFSVSLFGLLAASTYTLWMPVVKLWTH